ncbi:MAG: CBS domain-containing protein [Bacteroidetes bacterium]|nr:CBS domain-containing protein [Bacteroidota bacterium]
MYAIELIQDQITPLKTSDKGEDALGMMDELKVSHLPIVNDVQFLGLISDSDIYNMNNPSEPVGNHSLSLSRAFVYKNQHLFDVVKILGAFQLTLLPVLDENHVYLGSITLESLVDKMAHMDLFINPGGVILLEISENNYSLLEIVQIVESNDARILGVYISSDPDSTKLEVTLKVNKIEISSILQTFNRYNYIIRATFSEEIAYLEDLKDRYQSLLNYLNLGSEH